MQQMFVYRSISRPVCVQVCTYIALCYCVHMNYVNGSRTFVTVAMRGFYCT
jgi:hypothetical protein